MRTTQLPLCTTNGASRCDGWWRSTRRPLLAAATALAILVGPPTEAGPLAQPALPQAELIAKLGGAGRAVATFGDLVVLAVGAHLEMLDASDPSRLVKVGETHNLPRSITGLALGDDGIAYATYAANLSTYGGPAPGGLSVIDVSNPMRPVELGRIAGMAEARDVHVVGDRAYVADGDGGLKVVDVSVPSTPRLVGALGGSLDTVAVSGDHGYGAARGNAIHVIDVSHPTAPAVVAEFDDPSGTPTAAAVVGSRLYVVAERWEGVDRPGSLTIWDVADPTMPTMLGHRADLPAGASAIAVAGDRAYLVGRSPELRIVDVANPAAPIVVGAIDAPESTGVSLMADGGHVVVSEANAYWTNGLSVLDVRDPTAPARIARYDVPVVSNVAVAGDVLWLCDYDRGLIAYDAADPSRPRWLGEVDFPGNGTLVDASFAAGRAYAIVRENGGAPRPAGLWVVDVADPRAPALQGTVALPRYALESIALGDHAFVASGSDGLIIVDATDPLAPAVVATVGGGLFAQAIALEGDTLDVAGEARDGRRGVTLIDVSVPAAPGVRGFVAMSSGLTDGLGMAGGMVYIVGRSNRLSGRLVVIDASDVGHPRIVGEASVAVPASSVAVLGRTAVLGNDGVTLVDVSDPASPVILGTTETPGPAYQVVRGGDDWVVVREAGVLIMRVGRESPVVDRSAARVYVPHAGVGRSGAFDLAMR